MNWKYKISVVISICNTGKYLDQLLRSITMQTIGFEGNVQVIFVDDGSTDDSGAICVSFCNAYPDNIKYISFDKNQGTGIAWNTGMEHVEGKYVTFMESDGLWSLNAFKDAVDFLEHYELETDLVSADVEAYGTYLQPHCLNQDLDTEMLVDMNAEYRRLRVNGSCCIMKTEAARRHRFQEHQGGWEGTVFVNQVMLEKQKYGMLPGSIKYYYHGNRENVFASQQDENDKLIDVQNLELYFRGIYEESMEKCGCYMPMMQYLMAYILTYCFMGVHNILQAGEERYEHHIYQMLQYIDDGYLTEVCNADEFTKRIMLAFKHGVDLRTDAREREALLAQNQYLQRRRAADNANYNVLKKWFERKAQGRKTDSYFLYNGFRRIAVYGMSDLGKYMVMELGNSEVEVVYGIDRKAESIEADIPVHGIDDNLPEVDAFVVTAVFFFDEIQNDLSGKINAPIISIEDVLNGGE